jgi:hypothetical protein
LVLFEEGQVMSIYECDDCGERFDNEEDAIKCCDYYATELENCEICNKPTYLDDMAFDHNVCQICWDGMKEG